ncbi:ATP-binding protein [Streptomyces flavofungini]|uniref:ATP-binding protein n=1 Tax=Streptomyces flavofungini TaxID=68200 RepID=UPI0034DFFF07
MPTGDGGGERTGDDTLFRASHALEGDDRCIAEARHLAAAFLDQARTSYDVIVSARAVDLTQLVVSELVTNARKYAPGPVLMDLRIAGGMVEVVVWDTEPALPVPRDADPGRIGQHGLEIVMRITRHLSVHKEAVGKRVTARLPLDDPPRTGQ